MTDSDRTDPLGLQDAFSRARQAQSGAYAPYSGYSVGAALKISGRPEFVPGCNVENASYGAAICAERSAIVAAVSAGLPHDFEYLVVVTNDEPPAVPCALCLQVLAEFCSSDFPIHLANQTGIRRTVRLGDLLPEPFVLKKD